MKKVICLFLLFLFGLKAFAQLEFSGEASLTGMYSSKEELPFWFYSNQRGRLSQNSKVVGLLAGKGTYLLDRNSSFEFGGGLAFSDGLKNKIIPDEAYISYSNTWLRATLGIRHKAELYNGLSVTNENVLWSLNARSIPGVQLWTNGPLYFNENKTGLGLEAAWEEYWLGEDRYVRNALLHHKSLHLVYTSWNAWNIKAGIQHFAQWGGTSPDYGKQPTGFEDYLRIVAGRGGGGSSLEREQANALGNHLGSWELYVTRNFRDFSVQFIFNNLFEDGSGSRGANIPDGRYGIFVDFEDQDRMINSFIYEFYYTRDQSQTGPHLYDNYFNNGVYASGWTYKNRILGVPFFAYDKKLNKVVNNKFSAHHFGLSGQYSTNVNVYPYKLMLSYAHNEGTYKEALHPDGTNEDVLKVYTDLRLVNRPFLVNLELGGEFNSYANPIFGVGLRISKNF